MRGWWWGLCALSFWGCEGLSVPDPGRVPELITFSASPQEVLLDTIPAGSDGRISLSLRLQAEVYDPDGNLRAVRALCRDPYRARALAESELLPAGGNRYTGELRLLLSRGEVGRYIVYAWAVDRRNRTGNLPRLEFTVRATGAPPRILEVLAPTQVRIPAQGRQSFDVAARVYDPDGLETIVRVYMLTPGGGEIDLYDDGRSNETGDQRAGDGIFTRRLSVSSTDVPGSYTFLFYAVDRAGLRSEGRAHSIELIR